MLWTCILQKLLVTLMNSQVVSCHALAPEDIHEVQSKTRLSTECSIVLVGRKRLSCHVVPTM